MVRLTHFGHACILYDDDRSRLLFDPGTLSAGFEDLTDLDGILVTHAHVDHLDASRFNRLVRQNPAATVVLAPGCSAAVPYLDRFVEAQEGAPLAVGEALVTPLGASHAVVHPDIEGVPNSAYLVGEGAFLHPGDSFVVPQAPVDVLAVPISGPWLKIGEAIDYLRAVRPRVAVPIHEAALASTETHLAMLESTASSQTQVIRPEHAAPVDIPPPGDRA